MLFLLEMGKCWFFFFLKGRKIKIFKVCGLGKEGGEELSFLMVKRRFLLF